MLHEISPPSDAGKIGFGLASCAMPLPCASSVTSHDIISTAKNASQARREQEGVCTAPVTCNDAATYIHIYSHTHIHTLAPAVATGELPGSHLGLASEHDLVLSDTEQVSSTDSKKCSR